MSARGVVFAICRGDGEAGDRDGEVGPGFAPPNRLRLDDVLVESEGIWADAEAGTVAELGGEHTPEAGAALYGGGHRDGARVLAERFGGDHSAIADTLLAQALAGFRRGLEPLPGAVEIVGRQRGRIPIADQADLVLGSLDEALAAVAA